jgi:hypothetical protein
LQLGGKGRAAVGLDLGDVDSADLQILEQGQGADVPGRVTDEPGQGDPDVTVLSKAEH